MKKTITILALAATLYSCEKECGCFEPVKAIEQPELWVEDTRYPMETEPQFTYLVKYRDKCGQTRTLNVSQATYENWQNATPICD